MNDLEQARQRRERRRATQPAGAFGPSAAKQQVINRVLAKVDAASERRDPVAYYAGRVPAPERITLALDCCGLWGPEVDRMLGGEEPMVDEWEAGTRVPDVTQVQALAELTGYLTWWFYEPPPPSLAGGFMCGLDGCQPLGQEGAQ